MSSVKEDYLENYRVDGFLEFGNVQIVSQYDDLEDTPPALDSEETAKLNEKLKKLQNKRKSIKMQLDEVNSLPNRRLADIQANELQRQLDNLDVKIGNLLDENAELKIQDGLVNTRLKQYLKKPGKSNYVKALAIEDGEVVERDFYAPATRSAIRSESNEWLEGMIMAGRPIEIAAPIVIGNPKRTITQKVITKTTVDETGKEITTVSKFSDKIKDLKMSPVIVKGKSDDLKDQLKDNWEKSEAKAAWDFTKSLFGGGESDEKSAKEAAGDAWKQVAKWAVENSTKSAKPDTGDADLQASVKEGKDYKGDQKSYIVEAAKKVPDMVDGFDAEKARYIWDSNGMSVQSYFNGLRGTFYNLANDMRYLNTGNPSGESSDNSTANNNTSNNNSTNNNSDNTNNSSSGGDSSSETSTSNRDYAEELKAARKERNKAFWTNVWRKTKSGLGFNNAAEANIDALQTDSYGWSIQQDSAGATHISYVPVPLQQGVPLGESLDEAAMYPKVYSEDEPIDVGDTLQEKLDIKQKFQVVTETKKGADGKDYETKIAIGSVGIPSLVETSADFNNKLKDLKEVVALVPTIQEGEFTGSFGGVDIVDGFGDIGKKLYKLAVEGNSEEEYTIVKDKDGKETKCNLFSMNMTRFTEWAGVIMENIDLLQAHQFIVVLWRDGAPGVFSYRLKSIGTPAMKRNNSVVRYGTGVVSVNLNPVAEYDHVLEMEYLLEQNLSGLLKIWKMLGIGYPIGDSWQLNVGNSPVTPTFHMSIMMVPGSAISEEAGMRPPTITVENKVVPNLAGIDNMSGVVTDKTFLNDEVTKASENLLKDKKVGSDSKPFYLSQSCPPFVVYQFSDVRFIESDFGFKFSAKETNIPSAKLKVSFTDCSLEVLNTPIWAATDKGGAAYMLNDGKEMGMFDMVNFLTQKNS